MISLELKKKVEDKVLSTLEKAQQVWGNDKIDLDLLPEISYNLTGTVAGKALYSMGKPVIKINTDLLIQNEDEMLNQMVPHEMAHIITHKLYNQYRPKPHGYEWRNVMTKLGLKPDRCHNMDVSTVKQKRNRYNCKCMICSEVFTVSSVIKNRIDNGWSYKHNNCGGKIIVSQIPI